MQKVIRYVVVSLLLATSSFAGVTISSPAPGSTSTSPVHFLASASSSSPIAAMRIYVDDNSVYTTPGSHLDTLVALSSGSHRVVVVAWNTQGAPSTASETITVVTAGNVAVNSPGDNATVSSPFQVVASASAGNPIVAMYIYLDNQVAFQTSSASINTQLTAGVGQHLLVVQAWDTTGAVYKQPLTVNVNDSSVPPNATVVSQIQQLTGWGSCTVCAGEGGNGPPAGYSQEQFQSSPSLSGNSSKFTIWGSNPWADVLWWKDVSPNDNATNYRYDLDFYIVTPQYSQSLEFDVNVNVGSIQTYFIFGTQCAIGDGVWDVWDTAGNRWVNTGIACPVPAANTWHHVTWEFQRDNSQAHFVALTFDGVKHYVNMAFWAKQGSWPALNVAFQMDGDAHMDTYSVWLDNVTLSYW